MAGTPATYAARNTEKLCVLLIVAIQPSGRWHSFFPEHKKCVNSLCVCACARVCCFFLLFCRRSICYWRRKPSVQNTGENL